MFYCKMRAIISFLKKCIIFVFVLRIKVLLSPPPSLHPISLYDEKYFASVLIIIIIFSYIFCVSFSFVICFGLRPGVHPQSRLISQLIPTRS